VSATPVPVAATNVGGGGALRRLMASLRPIRRLLLPYRGLLIWGVVAGLMVALFTLGAALAGAYLVGRALTGANASDLVPIVWLIMVLVVPIAVFGWLEGTLVHVLSFRLLNDLRCELFDRFRDLAPAYFLERRSGDVTRVAMSDVELIEVFTSHLVPPFIVALIVPFLALVGLFLMHWALGLVVLPFVLLVASVPSWLLRRAEEQGQAMRHELGELGANVVDVVQGVREVSTTGSGPRFLELIGLQHERLARASVAHGRRSGLEQGATDALTSVAMIATLGVAAVLVTNGSLPAQWFPAAVILAGGAFAPIVAVTGVAREVSQVSAAADRITELLEARPAVSDLVDRSPSGPVEPTIEFRDVRFRYGPDLPDVLHGVSFTIAEHETVALVGHSGAGKSTCANLLLRLWDPAEGAIAVGGHDLRSFVQRDLRARIAVVPQDTYLFHTTVRENVRLGRDDATDAELVEAAKAAQALEFIEALPDGWDTVLGERGLTLSAGQRQRLAIARALLKDAPILLMDEAVSNLDAGSEEALHRALREASSRRTTLLIAHRPSTIRLADRVLVMEAGRIVESGTFDELAAAGGTLARLLLTPSGLGAER
jgi:ATP-binding cassette, subfamily C, bacterial CydC